MSDIIINLYTDFAAACGAALSAAGYTLPSGSEEEIVRAYANVQHRRVLVKARTVHKAPYTVPPELVDGEEALLDAVAAGDDLRPYQSTKLESATYDDGMLNDFGVQHFHLGTGPHQRKPSFKARTGPLLFAMVEDDDFYSIGIYTHHDWAQLNVLDTLHANWPDVIGRSSPNSAASSAASGSQVTGLAHNYNSEDLSALRNAGINTFTQREDGTIHGSIGGGITSNGKSARVSMQLIQIKDICDDLERQIKEHVKADISSRRLTKPTSIRLDIRTNGTFAIIEGAGREFDLNRALSVPAL